MVIVDGYSGYVPLYRIDREEISSQYGGSSTGETAVPGKDENHITMAVEAANSALDRSGIDPSDLGAVCAASITDPFAEHGIAAHVTYQLGADGTLRTGDFRATGRAGTDAFCFGHQYVQATDEPALVVGVDVMPAEPDTEDEVYAGAGAGAVVLRSDGEAPGARITAVGQQTTGFVERHRLHGESPISGDQAYEGSHGFRRAIEPATQQALAGVDDELEYAIVVAPDYRMAKGAVKSVPGDVSFVSTYGSVGYAGTASLFIDLAKLLETAEPGAAGLAGVYGAGGADVIAFETGDGVQAEGLDVDTQIESKEYISYGRHLQYRERTEYKGGPGL